MRLAETGNSGDMGWARARYKKGVQIYFHKEIKDQKRRETKKEPNKKKEKRRTGRVSLNKSVKRGTKKWGKRNNEE